MRYSLFIHARSIPVVEGARKMSTSPEITLMNPVFSVANLSDSIDYYRDALGFELSWQWGTPIIRAAVAAHGYEIQLDASGSGPTGRSVVYFHMKGLSSYYQACCKRGANVELELDERAFKMRDFRVLDLDNNRLGFGEPLE